MRKHANEWGLWKYGSSEPRKRCMALELQSATWFRDKRVKGIEPSSVAWEATALPLSYTRAGKAMVAMRAATMQRPPNTG